MYSTYSILIALAPIFGWTEWQCHEIFDPLFIKTINDEAEFILVFGKILISKLKICVLAVFLLLFGSKKLKVK